MNMIMKCKVITSGNYGMPIYDEFYTKDITEAKRKASKFCNKFNATIDELRVILEDGKEIIFFRRNHIYPWNETVHGRWN